MIWIMSVASLLATVAMVYKKWWSFLILLITDFYWIVVDYQTNLYGQSFMFVVYAFIAIWGLVKWHRGDHS
jgi:nicotinamide riboside transporter PnuC